MDEYLFIGNPSTPISRGPPGTGIPSSIRHRVISGIIFRSAVYENETKDRDPTLIDRSLEKLLQQAAPINPPHSPQHLPNKTGV